MCCRKVWVVILLVFASGAWAQEGIKRYVFGADWSMDRLSLKEEVSYDFLDLGPNSLWIDTSRGQAQSGREVREQGFRVFRTASKAWIILGTSDSKVVSLLSLGADEPVTGRLWDGGNWIEQMKTDVPFMNLGYWCEGSLVSDAVSVPSVPGQDVGVLFQTPDRSWLSSANPVGARLEMEVPWGTKLLVLANGFINKANLGDFRKYSRVRNVEVAYGSFRQTLELADIPDYQAFNLNQTLVAGQKLTLTIRSVYAGTDSRAGLNEIIPVRLGRE